MQPAITDGDFVLVNLWSYAWKNPRVGDIVVFRSKNKLLCKRIVEALAAGFSVAGDNTSDTWDSNQFGQINQTQILGRVITPFRFSRKFRR